MNTTLQAIEVLAETMTIQDLIDLGALFVINDSGGKDSQAMKIKLMETVPHNQLVVIHAHLEGVEWKGTEDHVRKYSGDLPVHVVRAKKTFLEMVEARGMWPSPKYRQCTSDLKKAPIEKEIRRILFSRENKLIVNCMGLRKQESSCRAKKEPFKLNIQNSRAKRIWFDYLPIFEMSEAEVFDTIENAGQEPHWAYAEGMTRLSCIFCIMASKNDLKTAAKLNPGLLEKYCETEKKINHTFIAPSKKEGKRYLNEILNAA